MEMANSSPLREQIQTHVVLYGDTRPVHVQEEKGAGLQTSHLILLSPTRTHEITECPDTPTSPCRSLRVRGQEAPCACFHST